MSDCKPYHAYRDSGNEWTGRIPGLWDIVRLKFALDAHGSGGTLVAYQECGILVHGFLRVSCAECAHEKLVAFTCKRRGFCPSCGACRIAETAAVLVDRVVPRVPVRQWVLSFPITLRILFAAHPELLTPVLGIVHGSSRGS
ncbi:MAG: transposase zinc-binding domain-containing protein [Cyanobium sp.]